MTDDAENARPGPPAATDAERSDGKALTASTSDRSDVGHPSAPPRRRFRRLKRLILLVGVPVLMLIGASWWYSATGRYISTENAYVKAHVIAISTDLDGRVIDVKIRNNQRVEKGDLLFRLDPDPHWLALQLAQARVETARNDIQAKHAEFHQAQSEIDEAQERVEYLKREVARQRDLAGRGIMTRSQLDETEFELASATQRVNGMRQKLARVLAELGGDPERAVELDPKYMAARAEVEMAELKLAETEIRAPSSGIVTQVHVEPGEWLEEGEPVFGLIEVDDTWVIANLKETQLTHIQEGQEVEVRVDAYPDLTWKARLTSIAPATGAEFAVLPPQNASGNWVKVVQRVPVRIDLEGTEGRPQLRAGMTASISIDTKRQRQLLTTAREALAGWVHQDPKRDQQAPVSSN
jgi:membrane fusion protein (multidrug efflux system)